MCVCVCWGGGGALACEAVSLLPPLGGWGSCTRTYTRCPASKVFSAGRPSPHGRASPGLGHPRKGDKSHPPPGPGAHGALTQQRRAAVPQRVALVAGDAERRQGVESPLQQRLQARGRRVGGVEQVVDLLAGGPQLENWGLERGGQSQSLELAPPSGGGAYSRLGLGGVRRDGVGDTEKPESVSL